MEREIILTNPPNYGWIQTKLHSNEIEYLWDLLRYNNKNEESRMGSQTEGCYQLNDLNDYLYKNVLSQLVEFYEEQFGNNLSEIPIKSFGKYCLSGLWVNYQKQYDFFPLHTHNGVYSFVVWMKIPTNFEDQIKDKPKLKKVLFDGLYTSNFSFNYTDILGKNKTYEINMNSDVEGSILFFPSKLQHMVYPFYNCSEERISISGNISINI